MASTPIHFTHTHTRYSRLIRQSINRQDKLHFPLKFIRFLCALTDNVRLIGNRFSWRFLWFNIIDRISVILPCTSAHKKHDNLHVTKLKKKKKIWKNEKRNFEFTAFTIESDRIGYLFNDADKSEHRQTQ